MPTGLVTIVDVIVNVEDFHFVMHGAIPVQRQALVSLYSIVYVGPDYMKWPGTERKHHILGL